MNEHERLEQFASYLDQLAVPSVDSLEQLLRDAKIDTGLWGQSPYKSIDRLYDEIDAGESRLVRLGQTVGRLVSVVNVLVTARIGNCQYQLVEDRQVFPDGSERHRGIQGVSEKIKGDEDPVASARRGLAEELGVVFTGELTGAGAQILRRPSSHSYPNLPGIYMTHVFNAEFGESEWDSDGYSEVQPDKATYFIWKEV